MGKETLHDVSASAAKPASAKVGCQKVGKRVYLASPRANCSLHYKSASIFSIVVAKPQRCCSLTLRCQRLAAGSTRDFCTAPPRRRSDLRCAIAYLETFQAGATAGI